MPLFRRCDNEGVYCVQSLEMLRKLMEDPQHHIEAAQVFPRSENPLIPPRRHPVMMAIPFRGVAGNPDLPVHMLKRIPALRKNSGQPRIHPQEPASSLPITN